jgi:membrane protein DedA with SNARE-associated domain
MPVARFVALTALGSAVWNCLLIGAGWALGSRWREATELVEGLDVWVYVGVVAAVAAAYGAHRVRRARPDP